MKKSLFILLLTVLVLSGYAQKIIHFSQDKASIEGRKFYVIQILDERENKEHIGEINDKISSESYKINVEGGVLEAVRTYFSECYKKTSDDQVPVNILINKINVEQRFLRTTEEGAASVELSFQKNDGTVIKTEAEILGETDNAFASHESRVRYGLLKCAQKFNRELSMPETSEGTENAIEISFEDNNWNENKQGKKQRYHQNGLENLFTIGYQIGGYNLIGFNYEKRIHKHFGIHGGIGLLGFTGGVKIHTNTSPSGLFINLSWKDAGIGLLNGFGIEAGSRWMWSKKRNFGLLYQGGFFILNYIDPDLERELYGGNASPVSLSLGVGLSW